MTASFSLDCGQGVRPLRWRRRLKSVPSSKMPLFRSKRRETQRDHPFVFSFHCFYPLHTGRRCAMIALRIIAGILGVCLLWSFTFSIHEWPKAVWPQIWHTALLTGDLIMVFIVLQFAL